MKFDTNIAVGYIWEPIEFDLLFLYGYTKERVDSPYTVLCAKYSRFFRKRLKVC